MINTLDKNIIGSAKTIGDVVESAQVYADMAYDYKVRDKSGLQFDVDGKDVVAIIRDEVGYQRFPVAPHALNGIYGRYGMPSGYFNQIGGDLIVPHLQHWSTKIMPRGGWTIRAFGSESRGIPTHVRAALSGHYAKVDNYDILNSVQKVMDFGGVYSYRLARPFLNAHEMSFAVLIDDLQAVGEDNRLSRKERGNYGFGFKISNSEIGTGSFRIGPVIQRTSCTNSITFQEGTFIQRHYGYNASKAFQYATIAEHVGTALRFSTQAIDQLVNAEAVNIPKITDVIKDLCKKHKIPANHRDVVIHGTEGGNNLLAVVNGFSYAAHAVPGIGVDESAYYSDLAGAFLAHGLTARLNREVDVD